MKSPRPSTPRQWAVLIVALLAVAAIGFAGFKLVFDGDDTGQRQELTEAVETYQTTRTSHEALLVQAEELSDGCYINTGEDGVACNDLDDSIEASRAHTPLNIDVADVAAADLAETIEQVKSATAALAANQAELQENIDSVTRIIEVARGFWITGEVDVALDGVDTLIADSTSTLQAAEKAPGVDDGLIKPVKDGLAEIKDLQKTLTSEYDTMRESDRAEDVTRLFQLHGSLSADRKKLESAIKAAGGTVDETPQSVDESNDASGQAVHGQSSSSQTPNSAAPRATGSSTPSHAPKPAPQAQPRPAPKPQPTVAPRPAPKPQPTVAPKPAPKPQPTVTPKPKPVDIARATWVCEGNTQGETECHFECFNSAGVQVPCDF